MAMAAALAVATGAGGLGLPRARAEQAAPGPAARVAPAPAPDAPPRFCIQPLGKLGADSALLGPVQRGVAQVYGFTVDILPARPLPRDAWYAPRKRYRAERLLAFLDAEVVPDAGCRWVMGFTRVDISTTKDARHTDWGILGLASIGGTAGVVSSFRMKRRVDAETIVRRAVKVVHHELGHLLGLGHDDSIPGCIMNDGKGSVATVDEEAGTLCPHERTAAERASGLQLPAVETIDWPHVLGSP
jgi:archaemetzincin